MAKGGFKQNSSLISIQNPWKAKGTGYQVRDYLSKVNSDSMMNIWRAIKFESESQQYKYPTWESFRNFFSLLKKAGLVVEDTTNGRNSAAVDTAQSVVPTAYPKKYWKLNQANYNSTAWNNVYNALGYRTNDR